VLGEGRACVQTTRPGLLPDSEPTKSQTSDLAVTSLMYYHQSTKPRVYMISAQFNKHKPNIKIPTRLPNYYTATYIMAEKINKTAHTASRLKNI